MFRLWSDLRKDAVGLELRTADLGDAIAQHQLERLYELTEKEESLHAEEPTPHRKLLERFQEDENEREWGKGIRSAAQVEAERARRLELYATASASGVSEGDRG